MIHTVKGFGVVNKPEATSCEELTHWKRLWCWEGLGAGGEGDDRGWDGWMASLTRWMWGWVNSRSWWWTGRPGVLRFMGSQRVGHDWATDLIWSEMLFWNSCFFDDPADVVNLISGSSAFSKSSLNIWKFTVYILLKPGLENFEHYFASMWNECNCVVVWTFFGEGNGKECSNYHTIALISHASKVMLKILQARLQ